MVRSKKYIVKIFCSVIIHGIYYFTTLVRICLHDAIDEWYRLLIHFVMFEKQYDKEK